MPAARDGSSARRRRRPGRGERAGHAATCGDSRSAARDGALATRFRRFEVSANRGNEPVVEWPPDLGDARGGEPTRREPRRRPDDLFGATRRSRRPRRPSAGSTAAGIGVDADDPRGAPGTARRASAPERAREGRLFCPPSTSPGPNPRGAPPRRKAAFAKRDAFFCERRAAESAAPSRTPFAKSSSHATADPAHATGDERPRLPRRRRRGRSLGRGAATACMAGSRRS